MTPEIDYLLIEQTHFRADDTSITLKVKGFIGEMQVVRTVQSYLCSSSLPAQD